MWTCECELHTHKHAYTYTYKNVGIMIWNACTNSCSITLKVKWCRVKRKCGWLHGHGDTHISIQKHGIMICNTYTTNCQYRLYQFVGRHWYRQWLGVVRQQATSWARGDPYCCYVASLGRIGLIPFEWFGISMNWSRQWLVIRQQAIRCANVTQIVVMWCHWAALG